MTDKPTRSLSQKLKDKYRLIIYNDDSFEEVGYIRLKGFNLLWILGATSCVMIALVVMLIAFTSLKELIPGYMDSKVRRQIVMNAIKLDSLQHQIEIRDRYFTNFNNLISGREPVDIVSQKTDSLKVKNIKFTRSKNDSVLRKQIEEEEQFNLSFADHTPVRSMTNLSQIHFFTPLRGVVTNPFNPEANHYGTDIVAGPNEVIKAVSDGTVVMATWTLETGYVIEIQHDNNLVSIYKHNAELLKKVNSRVDAGEAIAIVGNSGELTTGPHLHFELWYNGRPINPQDYIVF